LAAGTLILISDNLFRNHYIENDTGEYDISDAWFELDPLTEPAGVNLA